MRVLQSVSKSRPQAPAHETRATGRWSALARASWMTMVVLTVMIWLGVALWRVAERSALYRPCVAAP
jgi:heme/copper-type cytochrome/quinol oxidase subunit 2